MMVTSEREYEQVTGDYRQFQAQAAEYFESLRQAEEEKP